MKNKKITTMIMISLLILINFNISLSQTKTDNLDLNEKEKTKTSLIPITEHQNSEKLLKIFNDWEKIMIEKSIHDYVSKTDCENFDKMMVLYDNDKYPMHSGEQKVLEIDLNQDGIMDYIISYNLLNCVRGSGWSDDFIFIQSKKSNDLIIRDDLTLEFKEKYADFLSKKLGTELKSNENNYIEISGVNFISSEKNEVFGEIGIKEFSYGYTNNGNFIYNFKTKEFLANIIEN